MSKSNLVAAFAIASLIGLSSATVYYRARLNEDEAKLDKIKVTLPGAFQKIGELSFVEGCVYSVVQLTHIEETDPVFPMYVELCKKVAPDAVRVQEEDKK